MTNTNLELLEHIKDYQKSGKLSAEGWIFFANFVERLGYMGTGDGYAKTYPTLWQEMQEAAIEFIMRSSLKKCKLDDPDKAWAYISRCVTGIFNNTLNKHRRRKEKMDLLKYSIDNNEVECDDNVDLKDRPKVDMCANFDTNYRKRMANYLMKYPHKKMIITDDITEMTAFIGEQKRVKKTNLIDIKVVDDKVMITMPNGDVGYSGDMIFKATTIPKHRQVDKNYAMVVPEALCYHYNNEGRQ